MISSVPAAPRYRDITDEDSHQGFDALRERAEHGDCNSMFAMALHYDRGLGVAPQDFTEAFRWYRRAAEAGDRDAMFELARYYDEGVGGVIQDFDISLRWCRAAAVAGQISAMVTLGEELHIGKKSLEMILNLSPG